MRPVSINQIARNTHEQWLQEKDRGYSPFNAHWGALSADQRRQISRQTRSTIDQINAAAGHVAVPFVDEYAPAGPGDARWLDPEKLPANQTAEVTQTPTLHRTPQDGR